MDSPKRSQDTAIESRDSVLPRKSVYQEMYRSATDPNTYNAALYWAIGLAEEIDTELENAHNNIEREAILSKNKLWLEGNADLIERARAVIKSFIAASEAEFLVKIQAATKALCEGDKVKYLELEAALQATNPETTQRIRNKLGAVYEVAE